MRFGAPFPQHSSGVFGPCFGSNLAVCATGVLCLADKRVGVQGFLRVCGEEGLEVEVVPIVDQMLEQAQDETDDEDLGTERPHSLYFVRWPAPSAAGSSGS